MAVQDQVPYNQHVGNGLTTVFAFAFLLLLEDDLKVYLDGVLQTSGYTVSGVGNPTGGTVTFSVAPASSVVVLLDRDIPLERLTDYQDAGDLLADTLNRDFDRLWMAIQGESDINSRQLTLPQGSAVDADLPAPTAATVLRVNAAADGFEWATVDDATAITLPLSIAQGGTSATTAAAARTALGLGTAAVANTGTASGNVPVLNAQGKLAAAVQSTLFQPLSAGVAANALTFTLAAGAKLEFSDGTSYVLTAAITLTVPSGQAMGTSNGVASRLWVAAVKNGGTPELAIVNTWNGTDVFSVLATDIISTTAIAAAPSAHVWYSTTARASQAIAVCGYVESTQATAGTWASAPSLVQDYAPGSPLPGQTIQRRSYTDSAMATGATILPNDDTIPQSGEGNQFMSLAITPRSALNVLIWRHVGNYAVAGSATASICALFQDATANALAATTFTGGPGGASQYSPAVLEHAARAGTASATTGKIRVGNGGGTTTTFNGQSGARTMGGVMGSRFSVEEVMT